MKFAYLIEPPFNFRMRDGAVSGCDVDLARYVFSELGVDVFEPVETDFANLLPGVSKGLWRMTTGLFATEERRATAAFSRPIWALPDGLLVQKGNPLGLGGYRSAAAHSDCILAVIRDQVQHRSAITFGMPQDRILIFETYADAADAVVQGHAGAYASVARAHHGFLNQHRELELDVSTVQAFERPPSFGSFAFAKGDQAFRHSVNAVLQSYIGSAAHRRMMAGYGFSDAEIDFLV